MSTLIKLEHDFHSKSTLMGACPNDLYWY